MVHSPNLAWEESARGVRRSKNLKIIEKREGDMEKGLLGYKGPRPDFKMLNFWDSSSLLTVLTY